MIKSNVLLQQVNEFYIKKATETLAKKAYFDELLNQNKDYVLTYNEIGSVKLDIAKQEYLNNFKEVEKLKNSLDLLNRKLNKILEDMGYFKYFSNEEYDCEICKDKGYVNGKRCSCFNKKLTEVSLNYLGVSKKQPCYFENAKSPSIKKQKLLLTKFASNFPNNKVKGFVLTGKVGTGKTYLSRCVLSVVNEKGYNGVFLTANELNNIFLKMHIGEVQKTVINEILYNCDLLIIDDLGTEPLYNNVTVEYLLALISDRLDKNMPFIITTNLSNEELIEKYNERLVSRLKSTMFLPFNDDDLRN